MTRVNTRPEDPVEPRLTLQQKAEALLLEGEAWQLAAEPQSREAIRTMLHELRVHQIELEMQNEELRRTQWELNGERARYFDLYDLAPVGYCTVSEVGLILQANLTAASLLGMARGALVKERLSRFILASDQDIYYLCRRKLIESGQPQACELRMQKSDGTTIWVRLATTYALDDGDAPVLRMALSDVTESKLTAVAMEESEARYHAISNQLQDKNVELESARYMAEKASLAKSDFLSSMSHELRTPLSAILGFAQLLEAGAQVPTPDQQKSLEQIIKAGWYLLELINEILDLAQIESGKVPLVLESVELAGLVQECQDLVEPHAETGSITVTCGPLARPYFVHADRLRLKQALINLLSNAVKYNKPNGSVTVDCVEYARERIRIRVKDTGQGLTAEKIAQLFQPFNRLGQEASAVQGTGIGLTVCKRLVELMGGSIGVESTPGEGSLFWIELNLTAAAAAAAAAAKSTLPNRTHARTLLYVEDNPPNLELVQDLVARRADIRFLSAVDGQNGIEMARVFQPDVILMDINLPGISGLEALKILHSEPATAHIPVVALSANAMPGDIERGLKAGFLRYLVKPIKIGEFMQTLDFAFKFAETAAAASTKPAAATGAG